MLLLGGEVDIADSIPVHVLTRLTLTLCGALGVLGSYVVELDNGYLTSAQCTVGLDKELVVPSVAFANLFFSGITVIVGCQPVSLNTVQSNLCRIGNDLDGLCILITFLLDDVDLSVLDSKIDGPYTSSGELDLSVRAFCVVTPVVFTDVGA